MVSVNYGFVKMAQPQIKRQMDVKETKVDETYARAVSFGETDGNNGGARVLMIIKGGDGSPENPYQLDHGNGEKFDIKYMKDMAKHVKQNIYFTTFDGQKGYFDPKGNKHWISN